MKQHPLITLSRQYLLQKECSSSTRKSYAYAYRHFTQYLIQKNIEFATTRDVINYREYKKSLGYSSSWVYIQICALKGLYKYLKINQVKLGLPMQYKYDIMRSIKSERIKPHLSKPILTIEQAKHMILQTKNNRRFLSEYRNHAIIYLMLTTGCGRQDIIHALRSNYTFIEGCPVLILNEDVEDDYVKLVPGVEEAINKYLERREDDSPYLFVSSRVGQSQLPLSVAFFQYMFRVVLQQCGLEQTRITPHCLRHSAAIFSLQSGASLEETRRLLRHKDIKSTMVYKEYLDRLEDDSESEIEQFILGKEE